MAFTFSFFYICNYNIPDKIIMAMNILIIRRIYIPTIHFDYTSSDYNVGSGGIGISLRKSFKKY